MEKRKRQRKLEITHVRHLTSSSALVTVQTRDAGLISYIVPTRTPFQTHTDDVEYETKSHKD